VNQYELYTELQLAKARLKELESGRAPTVTSGPTTGSAAWPGVPPRPPRLTYSLRRLEHEDSYELLTRLDIGGNSWHHRQRISSREFSMQMIAEYMTRADRALSVAVFNDAYIDVDDSLRRGTF
jgi:hypothetical protein